MLAKIFSSAVLGVDAYPVEIEVNTGRGDPSVVIVGLPDMAVKESKDRVYTAIVNSGFALPQGRTTINLAPADMKKEGPSFDLPIAIGILYAMFPSDPVIDLDRFCIIGELALSGKVRRVKGVLPVAIGCRNRKMKGLIVPEENGEEAAVVDGIDVYPVKDLRQAWEFITGKITINPLKIDIGSLFKTLRNYEEDYADVKGQIQAKRAIEVAVAGGHNILMIGPPGTGKTMLAKRIPTILPELSLEEALEVTKVHSIAGVLEPHTAIVAHRPFRNPHHTISDAGLIGGGIHPAPGEVSLAHMGVLFLDELPEFKRNVLEVLRQPLEDGFVTISRSSGSVKFPCRFMLVAAMNPCPCGYYGDTRKPCRCSVTQIHNYRNKVSGPLLDRIDIHVEVPNVPYQDLAGLPSGDSSAQIRERVVKAREIQRERFKNLHLKIRCNADMTARHLQRFCEVSEDAKTLLKSAITELNLSARAHDRILKVARTIADLDASEIIEATHIAEAIQYRILDRQYW